MKTIFDKIYCLTLDSNIDRQNNITEILKDIYNIEFEFFYGFPFGEATYSDLFENEKVIPFGNYRPDNSVYIDYDDGRSLSIYISNYLSVLNAYRQGANNVLIIEDDACFHKDRNLVEKYLNIVPKDADVIRYSFCMGADNETVNHLKLTSTDKMYFKDNSNVNDRNGAMMFALMNRKTMKLYCDNIAKTLTGGDNPYNIFINNQYNLNIYYALTNIVIDHHTYYRILNNEIPECGYIPFDYDTVKNNINNYYYNG